MEEQHLHINGIVIQSRKVLAVVSFKQIRTQLI